MIVAIHQPNFFPWLGYFNKITRADVFCILDNVQFQKTGGTWTNRVRLAVGEKPFWATAPVRRDHSGTQSIRETRIDNCKPWRKKLLATLRTSYGQARFFSDTFPVLDELISNPAENLADFNVAAISALCERLALRDTRLVLASTLETSSTSTDRLVEIVQALGGETYLCGDGATGYQEDEKFYAAGIRLVRQGFQHPEYPQIGRTTFTSGLSVIDAVLNCGFAATTRLIRCGE